MLLFIQMSSHDHMQKGMHLLCLSFRLSRHSPPETCQHWSWTCQSTMCQRQKTKALGAAGGLPWRCRRYVDRCFCQCRTYFPHVCRGCPPTWLWSEWRWTDRAWLRQHGREVAAASARCGRGYSAWRWPSLVGCARGLSSLHVLHLMDGAMDAREQAAHNLAYPMTCRSLCTLQTHAQTHTDTDC